MADLRLDASGTAVVTLPLTLGQITAAGNNGGSHPTLVSLSMPVSSTNSMCLAPIGLCAPPIQTQALQTVQTIATPSNSNGMNMQLLESKCRVCNRIYDGSQHFGIEVCRACAAFFRRSVACKKRFVCRRGGDNCHLNTPRKVTCQKCRWVKCLDVGLQKELVNQKTVIKSNSPPLGGHVQQSSSPLDSDNVDDCDIKDERSSSADDRTTPLFKPKPTNSLPPSSVSPGKQRITLIYKIIYNYQEFCAKRIILEQSIAGHGDSPMIFNGKSFCRATQSRLVEIYKQWMPLLLQFLSGTFEEFRDLDDLERERVIQMFYPCFMQMESCYLSYKYLSPEDIENKLIATHTTYIDISNVGNLFADVGLDEKPDFTQFTAVIRNLVGEMNSILIRPMRNFNMTEIEFAALLALNLWSPKNHRGTLQREKLANKIRTSIFDELHVLYREEMKMDNYAKRFGELMCLFSDIQEARWLPIPFARLPCGGDPRCKLLTDIDGNAFVQTKAF
ncbi:hypothetical protein WR25_06339 [Diploscapter pachys]|uniref:Nuclear receptor domain-containing protein n=1 Tax=Diploscapter pachys TaxID=2018661 RepID=A0A2A2L9R0_9BILA|nr:hypothetical protein WR25_06339 [Diploscapter pachys]